MRRDRLSLYEVIIAHPATGWKDVKYIKAYSERQAIVIADGIVSGEHGDLAPYHEFQYKVTGGTHVCT